MYSVLANHYIINLVQSALSFGKNGLYREMIPAPKNSERQSSALLFPEKRHGSSHRQLTPIWEYVVRTQTLPQDIDILSTFREISERLRDPEWEVRQHALRVLIDMIPVMNLNDLDASMVIILCDLVHNLGHSAPAVRKGALESLRVYLSHSENSEQVLKEIIYQCLENKNDVGSNLSIGLILSIPSLVFPYKTSENSFKYPSVDYIVRFLAGQLVQITSQEVIMQTLLKLREMVGDETFEDYLDEVEGFDKMNFLLLCQVYDENQEMLGYYSSSFYEANNKISNLDSSSPINSEGKIKLYTTPLRCSL